MLIWHRTPKKIRQTRRDCIVVEFAGPLIEQQMQQILTTIPGIANVESEMVFNPPWSPERMSEDAKFALGY